MDVENKHTDTQGGKKVWGEREIGINIYTLLILCIE